jgi:hypothetical protein
VCRCRNIKCIKSEEYCKRYDPDDEPYKSKYLAREALKIAIAKLTPHANEEKKNGSAAALLAKDMIAKLNWRMASIYMGRVIYND